MNDAEGYGKRIRRALRVWASQFDTATYEEFGRRVAEIEGRDPEKGPYTTSAVSEWLQNRSEPKIATFKAIAQLTGFRAAWLMLGELPEREGEQGAKSENSTPKPGPTHRARLPLTEPEILETRYLTPKKKAARKRRPGDKSAVA